jgi:hypothetical protein
MPNELGDQRRGLAVPDRFEEARDGSVGRFVGDRPPTVQLVIRDHFTS